MCGRPTGRGFAFKDDGLERLAELGNVAQFVSFSPSVEQRYCRIAGFAPNHRFSSWQAAVGALFAASDEHRLNARSYRPDSEQGNDFFYALESLDAVLARVSSLTSAGFHVIANETVDVNDRGVSGVALGPVVEFAPGGTPRVVEHGRIASLPRPLAKAVLRRVYGFEPEIDVGAGYRVEFSVHPAKRGYRRTHTLLWEIQAYECPRLRPLLRWPNDFSEMLGDKVFGLLMADSVGLLVPNTTALSRTLAPFQFGRETGSDQKWLRTCPRTPHPGRFATVCGWVDPFELMHKEDPDGRELASLLIQDAVPALYSGAAIAGTDGQPIIEGVLGPGQAFMLGAAPPDELPTEVRAAVHELYERSSDAFGGVRLEWVYDGAQAWVVQLQQERAESSGATVVPGAVESEVDFDVTEGLDKLRVLVDRLRGTRTGIRLIGNVGMTSHAADVLRRNGVPSRIVSPP